MLEDKLWNETQNACNCLLKLCWDGLLDLLKQPQMESHVTSHLSVAMRNGFSILFRFRVSVSFSCLSGTVSRRVRVPLSGTVQRLQQRAAQGPAAGRSRGAPGLGSFAAAVPQRLHCKKCSDVGTRVPSRQYLRSNTPTCDKSMLSYIIMGVEIYT